MSEYQQIRSQINTNWNLSQYARNQQDLRRSGKFKEEQMIEVYNNRPPVDESDIKVKGKAITACDNQPKIKQSLGVINPEHRYEDPRISNNNRKFQQEEWYAKKNKLPLPKKPEDPLTEAASTLQIQAEKIHLKPTPVLEKEKPLMQDHLVNPYIYIKKIFKKNSDQVHLAHPDIWDKSTHQTSLRTNKQHPKQRPQTAQPTTKQEKQDLQKEKEERQQFYLQNMKMREFMFKFFKRVNRLLKEKKFLKVLYKDNKEDYDIKALFKIWCQQKQVTFKNNPEQYVSRDQFVDFLMTLGLAPEERLDVERFFEYCHDEVPKKPEVVNNYARSEAQVQENKWLTMFK